MESSKLDLICSVDIGGTFTDSVLVASDGTVVEGKALTTYHDKFNSGFFNSIESAGEKLGLSPAELYRNISMISHGSTVATNTVVENNGSRVGLLTTYGFEDTINMMRGMGRVTGEPSENILKVTETVKPKPLVPKELIIGVTERIDSQGEVIVPLNESHVREAARKLLEQNVDAVAISFLWSFKNPEHEQRAKEIIHEMDDSVFVTCGHEVTKTLGEYERTVAAVINAYVGPVTSRYLEEISGSLQTKGVKAPLLIMQCHGGMIPLERSKQLPVQTIGSGPVGGIMGCVKIMKELDIHNLIGTDMGGTSFDIGIIRDGQPLSAEKTVLEKYQYNVPNVEIISIGAGGGSIAWIDPYSKAMRVGPKSAKANPGPACYRMGGTEPTVTDADLLLGYIDPEAVFGFGKGRGLKPSVELAEKAMGNIAEQLGISTIEAALGTVEIVNAKMANLIENEVIGRGFDPRDFAVVAYGGAGPIHAAAYARDLGIQMIIVPGETSSVWSAFGISTSDIRYELEGEVGLLSPFSPESLEKPFLELEKKGAEIVATEVGEDIPVHFSRYAKIRYQWQRHELEIKVPTGKLDEAVLTDLLTEFSRQYEERYGSAALLPEARIEIVSVRCEPMVEVRKFDRKADLHSSKSPSDQARKPSRKVYFSRHRPPVDADIYNGSLLTSGNVVAGPAVIDLQGTSIVVYENQTVTKTDHGDYMIRINSNSEEE
ncbi:hydantoinase/oxoprolinase family protein [Paenibacillus naphthalenovorans]|uniref:hydantoinase/oxoprolinase family protein n=1 Tax=Paenibacillus naphthalenovorans TaxID=162209 RepID=UPI003D28AFD7